MNERIDAALVFCDYRGLLRKEPAIARGRLARLLDNPAALESYCTLLESLPGRCRRATIDPEQDRLLRTHGVLAEAVTTRTLATLVRDPQLLRELHFDLRVPQAEAAPDTVAAPAETTLRPAPLWLEVEAMRGPGRSELFLPVRQKGRNQVDEGDAVPAALAVAEGPVTTASGIGRYEIVRVLGEGGMGTVYLGRDPDLGRDVAIKLHRCRDSRPEVCRRSRDRFRRGVRAAALVPPHPNICPVHDVGDHGDEPFAVLEHIQGQTLADLLRTRRLSPRRAVRLACKIARALETLHRSGIVHRDVKPANILIDSRTREPMLTDFGLARVEDGGEPPTADGIALGTPGYWPPEQAQGRAGQVGPWSDVYSLGIVLQEMLTGRPAAGHSPALSGGPALDAVLARATAQAPRDRYPSGGALAEGLTDWLRGVRVVPPPAESGPRRCFLRMLPKTGRHFVGRDRELRVLDAAWGNRQTYLVSLVAAGGAGKSSLLNHWIGRMAQSCFRGAGLVYGWSFYRQGESQTTSDPFFAHALDWFGDPHPGAGSAEDKGERLARLVSQGRNLLVLDGLEALQGGGDADGARLRDPALAALLTALAVENRGLCVLSTRCPVRDLEPFADTTALTIELNQLAAQAGAELLRQIGVRGEDADLCRASEEYAGHALSLNLLGTYLVRFCGGDVSCRHQVRLLQGDREQVDQARRVMASYEARFRGQPELAVLRLLGLFDRPAGRREVAALCAPPAIAGLTEPLVALDAEGWKGVLARLRQARLIDEADRNQPGAIDAHVLVRQYFGQRLREEAPDAWREGHCRLYRHLRDLWKEAPGDCPEYPRTVEEIKPLYSAIYHACQAGLHQEALTEVYWPRIQRKRMGYSTRKLGLFGLDLEMLSWFFTSPWDQPIATLNDGWQVFLPSLAASRLRALGRLTEAVQPVEASLQGYIRRHQPLWASHEARHRSEVHLLLGNLDRALESAEEGVRLADESGDAYQRYAERAVQGAALHHLGRFDQALTAFEQAEAILRHSHPDMPVLYSLWGFRYVDLLLDLGRLDEVGRRGEQMARFWQLGLHERDPEGGLGMISSAVHALLLARLRFLQALAGDSGARTASRSLIDQALKELHRSGRLDAIPLGLLLRAAYRRHAGNYHGAFIDLREALGIASRGRMKLYEADCHLEHARLYLAAGERERASASLARADLLVATTGYHRRDRDLVELKAALERDA